MINDRRIDFTKFIKEFSEILKAKNTLFISQLKYTLLPIIMSDSFF